MPAKPMCQWWNLPCKLVPREDRYFLTIGGKGRLNIMMIYMTTIHASLRNVSCGLSVSDLMCTQHEPSVICTIIMYTCTGPAGRLPLPLC